MGEIIDLEKARKALAGMGGNPKLRRIKGRKGKALRRPSGVPKEALPLGRGEKAPRGGIEFTGPAGGRYYLPVEHLRTHVEKHAEKRVAKPEPELTGRAAHLAQTIKEGHRISYVARTGKIKEGMVVGKGADGVTIKLIRKGKVREKMRVIKWERIHETRAEAPEVPPEKGAVEKAPARVETRIEAPALGKPLSMDEIRRNLHLPIDLLEKPEVDLSVRERTMAGLHETVSDLHNKFRDLDLNGSVHAVRHGPIVSTYEVPPAKGERVRHYLREIDDIALATGKESVRMYPNPERGSVSIEVPNDEHEPVYARNLYASEEFVRHPAKVVLALGVDPEGKPAIRDLTEMRHLIIGGLTGTGKSVLLHTILGGIMYKHTPNDVKIVLIDPKRTEFGRYEGNPHLIGPVAMGNPDTFHLQARDAITNLRDEMERRNTIIGKAGHDNIDDYNRDNPDKAMHRIVCMVDEFGDLLANEDTPAYKDMKKQIKSNMKRQRRDEMTPDELKVSTSMASSLITLGNKGRSAGISMIIATQRPSSKIVSGELKANYLGKISFRTRTSEDSRIILGDGQPGAHRLLPRGDILVDDGGVKGATRVHTAFLNRHERTKIAQHGAKKQTGPPTLEPEERIDIIEEGEEETKSYRVDRQRIRRLEKALSKSLR